MRRWALSWIVLFAAMSMPQAHAGYTMVAAGYAHTCALADGGTVYCWGSNANGQLGLGSMDEDSHGLPTAVPGLPPVSALAAGYAHTCAVLQQGGSVRCWGFNGYGQLGLGTTDDSPAPASVAGPAGIVAIAAGNTHTCASSATGATYCWGANSKGQLGLDHTVQQLSPAPVPTLSGIGIQSLAAGYQYTCAATAQGGVLCWGGNASGTLGVGDFANRKIPTGVSGLGNGSSVTSVVAGERHACAIKSGGKLMCWGSNEDGQLGQQGDLEGSNVPLQVLSGGATRVATGDYHTCAVLTHYLYCWGKNTNGQLGTGDNENHRTPVSIYGWYVDALSIAAGHAHSCLTKADGEINCWCANYEGQLGLGLAVYRSRPAAVNAFSVSGASGEAALSVGNGHACALAEGSVVACWGANGLGQLGIGDHSDRVSPVIIGGLPNAVAVKAGGSGFTCSLLAQGGTARCWGRNAHGQLGDNSTTDSVVPVNVHGIANATALAAGFEHACILRSGGTVACWGYNGRGQLGRGTESTVESLPADVPGLDSISKLVTGDYHTCALSTGGSVFCWGANHQGELGIGTTIDQSSPVQIPTLTNIVSISAGDSHTCALKSDGSVWCWGYNVSGQLGIGEFSYSQLTPMQVPGLSGVVQVSAGSWHTCATKASGSVVCWGFNGDRELGLDDPSDRALPVTVPGVSSAIVVSAGQDSTCALKSDKSILCWGGNYYGQLGSGTLGYARRPTELDHILQDGFEPAESP